VTGADSYPLSFFGLPSLHSARGLALVLKVINFGVVLRHDLITSFGVLVRRPTASLIALSNCGCKRFISLPLKRVNFGLNLLNLKLLVLCGTHRCLPWLKVMHWRHDGVTEIVYEF
jgi:hypothetical protein